MQLTSEVENVSNGSFVKKTDNLKAIAVSAATISPDASGIVPLAKQNALLTNTQPSDVITDKPVEVTPPENLESLSFTAPGEEPAPVEAPVEEAQEAAPLDITLPAPEEVLAQEPTGTNTSLFVNDGMPPILDSTAPAETPTETPQEAPAEEPTLENPISEPMAEEPTPQPELPALEEMATPVEETPETPETPEPVEAPMGSLFSEEPQATADIMNTVEETNQLPNENSDDLKEILKLVLDISNKLDSLEKMMGEMKDNINNVNIKSDNNKEGELEAIPSGTPNENIESVDNLIPPMEPQMPIENVPLVPELDNSTPEETPQEAPQEAPVDDLMADALTQINNLTSTPTENMNASEIPSVDDTQIKGMFI